MKAAPVGADGDEDAAERVVDAGGALGQAGSRPDQSPDVGPMRHQLVKCRYDPYGCFGLGVDPREAKKEPVHLIPPSLSDLTSRSVAVKR